MITKDRQYRSFEVRALPFDDSEKEYRVEGYAAVFEDPTVMYEYDGIQYKEVIDRNAFSGTQMTDVVMNFNHGGKPVARTKNQTLELRIDDTGLKIIANLKGTEEGRKLYEEIQGGYIDKMSFAFTVSAEEYNKDTRTRRITGIKRLYDVAAVDIPAYDTTSISARSFFEAEAQREMAEAIELEHRKQRIRILANL